MPKSPNFTHHQISLIESRKLYFLQWALLFKQKLIFHYIVWSNSFLITLKKSPSPGSGTFLFKGTLVFERGNYLIYYSKIRISIRIHKHISQQILHTSYYNLCYPITSNKNKMAVQVTQKNTLILKQTCITITNILNTTWHLLTK